MLDVQPQCYGSHGNHDIQLIPLSRQKSHPEKKKKYPRPYNSSIPGNIQGYDGWGFGKHDLVEGVPAKGRGVETR